MKERNIDQIIKEISNKIWRKRGRWHHGVIFSEIFAEGESTTYSNKIGYPFEKKQTVWLANGDYLDLQEDWDKMRKAIEEGIQKDPRYLKKYSDNCLIRADELISYCMKIKKQKVEAFSNEKIMDLYRGMAEEQKMFMPFMTSLHLVDEILTERFNTTLSAFIKDKSLTQSDFFDYQTALTFPYRKILVLEEQDNLLKIAVKIKKQKIKTTDPEIKKLLRIHTEKYSWINAYLFERLPYTVEDFTNRLHDLLKTDVEKVYSLKLKAEKDIKKKQSECMKKISSYSELTTLSKEIQIFGFLRSYRVDVPFYSFVMAMNLIEEIAKRLGISTINLKYLDSNEMAKGLNKEPNLNYQKLIEERKKGFITVVINNDRYEFTDENAKKVAQVVLLPVEKNDGVVKGMTAFPGKVAARCKVLLCLDDMKKIEQGDVMVIAMTDPNYIPAMTRASAFVTDQGGILCHAAIVSREMKKPCIIGTKIATKVLKDGDLVEVDANRGIVRILKN